jgi:hypothetical protein
MEFDLRINHTRFCLGDRLEKHALASAKFHRAGLVTILSQKMSPLGKQFVARDCTMTCFGDEFHLYPCRDLYLDRERQWKTSATLFYKKGRLHRILVRVIDGQYAAVNFLQRFQEVCIHKFGTPSRAGRSEYSWESNGKSIGCILDEEFYNASFNLKLR